MIYVIPDVEIENLTEKPLQKIFLSALRCPNDKLLMTYSTT
jgi:hypothetical protein